MEIQMPQNTFSQSRAHDWASSLSQTQILQALTWIALADVAVSVMCWTFVDNCPQLTSWYLFSAEIASYDLGHWRVGWLGTCRWRWRTLSKEQSIVLHLYLLRLKSGSKKQRTNPTTSESKWPTALHDTDFGIFLYFDVSTIAYFHMRK